VELLLAQTKQELKSVNSQLSDQKRCVEEFKLISETAEKRMLESSKAMADYRQGCGSGSGLDPNSIGSVDPVPGGQK
jgi:hypothetical protein